jgi:hypothetical protein
MQNGHARAGCARDDLDRWLAQRLNWRQNTPVCSCFSAGSRVISWVKSAAGGRRKTGGRLRQRWQQKIPVCRMFSAGATGLEPATSGVTGRSWRFRTERGSAGIPAVSRSFDPGLAEIRGSGRELPAASCGICAGCAVAEAETSGSCSASTPDDSVWRDVLVQAEEVHRIVGPLQRLETLELFETIGSPDPLLALVHQEVHVDARFVRLER